MLVDKAGCVVDLIMDNDVEVLLGVVLRNVGVGEFLGGHGERVEICCFGYEEAIEWCRGREWTTSAVLVADDDGCKIAEVLM